MGNCNFKVKLLPHGRLPERAHDTDAGFDLFADIKVMENHEVDENGDAYITIPPQQNRMINVGFRMALTPGYWGGIYARSGMAVKKGLRPANATGVIDSSYRGDVIVALYNDDQFSDRRIYHGDKIAQMVIHELPDIVMSIEFEDLDETERGEGGFGSSGAR